MAKSAYFSNQHGSLGPILLFYLHTQVHLGTQDLQSLLFLVALIMCPPSPGPPGPQPCLLWFRG